MAVLRYRSSHVVSSLRTIWAILEARLGLLGTTIVLSIVSYELDARFGNAAKAFIGLNWTLDRTREILILVATSSAASVAILLSVSLIVLQSASQRYGNRVVRYLINEEVGGYVLNSLVLALLIAVIGMYTATVLTVSLITPLLSSLLLAFGLLSLVVYRGYALAFLTPRRTADDLARNIINAVAEVARPNAIITPAVADYLRRRCVEWLDSLRELGRILATETVSLGEESAAITSLLGVLGYYGRVKVRIAGRSAWFPEKTVEALEDSGWTYFEQRRMFRSLGFGRPVTRTQDNTWFEDRVMAAVRELTDDTSRTERTETISHLITGLTSLGEATAESEEDTIMSAVLDVLALETQAVNESNVTGWGALVVSGLFAIANAHLKRLQNLRAPESTSSLKWSSQAELEALGLPRLEHDVVSSMLDKLTIERDYSGHIVTPTSFVQAELDNEFASTVKAWHRRAVERILGVFRTVTERSLAASSPNCSSAWVSAQLVLGARCFVLGEPELAGLATTWVLSIAANVFVLVRDDTKTASGIADRIEDLLLLAVQSGRHDYLQEVFLTAFRILVLEHDRAALADDLQRAVTGQIRMMVVAAYAVLLSELDEQPKTREAVKSTIQKVFSEPSKVVASWEVLTQPKMSLALNVGTEIIGRYHDVWLQFKRRVDALPEVLDWDRGIPYSSHANHPSDLVQRLSRNQMWGVAEIIEDLVTDFPTKTDGSTDSEN